MTKRTGNKPLVLLLEDEALIALDIQDELQDAGYEVAGPFTTCSAALDWLRIATPDTAILDAALKDDSCREVALELRSREVPFTIYSGYGADRELMAEFDHSTWIEKPVPPSMLVQVCRQQLLVGFG